MSVLHNVLYIFAVNICFTSVLFLGVVLNFRFCESSTVFPMSSLGINIIPNNWKLIKYI